MKVRLALTTGVLAVVLALSIIAFTPIPTAAAGPTGFVICASRGDIPPKDGFITSSFFGPNTTVADAIKKCMENGGQPVGVVID